MRSFLIKTVVLAALVLVGALVATYLGWLFAFIVAAFQVSVPMGVLLLAPVVLTMGLLTRLFAGVAVSMVVWIWTCVVCK